MNYPSVHRPTQPGPHSIGATYSAPPRSGGTFSGGQHSAPHYANGQYSASHHSGPHFPGPPPPHQWPSPARHSYDYSVPPAGLGPGVPPLFPARPNARYPAAPPRPPARRKSRLGLVIGLVIWLIVVAGLAAAAVFLTRPAEPVRVPTSGTTDQPGTLSVFELQAGDCYRTAQAPPPPGQAQSISVVQAVQCGAAHTNQVISKITYSPAEYATGVPPAKADADCSAEFQAKLDSTAFSDPTLKPGRLTPADTPTWARTPVVACVVFSDQPISRSLLR